MVNGIILAATATGEFRAGIGWSHQRRMARAIILALTAANVARRIIGTTAAP